MVRRANEKMLDGIFFLFGQADDALAAASLHAIGVFGQLFDVAIARDGDNDIFFGNQIFGVRSCASCLDNLRATRVAVLFFDARHVVLDDAAHFGIAFENAAQTLDFLQQIGVFVIDFHAVELRQLTQAHIQNRVGLNFRQRHHLPSVAFLPS